MTPLPPEKPKHPDRPKPGSDAETAGWYRMTGVGIEFIVAIAMLGAAGYYVDRWLNTRPVFLLIGGGIGFAVGLWIVIRTAMKSFK
jgi:F0F1-type ATP synthase assembly protein I